MRRALVTADEAPPMSQQKYSANFLRATRYHDADQRIDVLSRLPDLIQGATSDAELCSRLVNVLLLGVPRADHVAIVDASFATAATAMQILRWDSTTDVQEDFRPSERLIRQAVGEVESIIHIWNETARLKPHYTQRDNIDWAFCTPVPGKACQGWALYVAGSFAAGQDTETSESSDFHDDLKFAESAAAMLGNLRDIKQLERGHAALSQFFSPLVLDIVNAEDPEVVLAPRQADVAVMFCDLRGFSLHAERGADDLFGLLARVSEALGVMTRHILLESGVVGDFQGDSVMGFWGWPLPQPDAAVRACQTALAIRRELDVARHDADHPLGEFALGIGIASGPAVAGKIGTMDQFKVTVFGPVVNLAARLEAMTKDWKTTILLDDTTARAVDHRLRDDEGRLRPLAKVQPYGMIGGVGLQELLLAEDEYPEVSSSQLQATKECQRAIAAHDWAEAHRLLGLLSAEDGYRLFMENWLAGHPPHTLETWDGLIRMSSK